MDNWDEFRDFRGRVEAILPTLATKAEMEALRADIARWTLATVIGLFLGFSGLFVGMGNLYWKQEPPAARTPPQPPVIIYVPAAAPAAAAPQEKSPR
jgi:hypothetical protein